MLDRPILEEDSNGISMSVNLKKTVCMVFSPFDKRKVVCGSFLPLKFI